MYLEKTTAQPKKFKLTALQLCFLYMDYYLSRMQNVAAQRQRLIAPGISYGYWQAT